MKTGNFSAESIELFKELVNLEGGESSISSEHEDPFAGSLKTSSSDTGQIIAELGVIRGEYIDNYDYTRCVRPNGTVYGTRGRCVSGVETSAKPERLTEQRVADMGVDQLQKLEKKYKSALMKKSSKLPQEHKKFLESEAKRLSDEIDTRKVNDFLREQNTEKGKKKSLLRMRIKELQDKMDDAVTVQQQQRISSAISETQKKLESGDLKERYSREELSQGELKQILG